MIKLIEEDTIPFAENTLQMKEPFLDITNCVINTFIEVEYPFYKNYNKLLNGLTDLEVQNITFDFLNSYDPKLLKKYKEKLEVGDVYDVRIYSKTRCSGLTYPLETIKRNIMLYDSDVPNSIFSASMYMHEFGHSCEHDIAYQCGVTKYGSAIDKLPFSEVSSRFFEYAFFNYLKENKICEKDVDMCLHTYFKTMLSYIYKMNIIYNMDFVRINKYGYAEIEKEETSKYANDIKERLNYFALPSEIGEGINYKDSFVYGIGGIFGIYLYENYKEDPNNFKREFRNALINYKYSKMDAFERVGITPEILTEGKILKKVLKDNK